MNMINIETDSRKIKKGDIFVALKGISSNGDEYISNAISNGASKVVCESGSYDVETIIVDDTKKYLEDYLETNYKKYLDEMTLICITGTNGKTTGAFIIYELLNKLGLKCGYLGTIGYYLDDFVSYSPNSTPDLCTVYHSILEAYEKGFRYFVLEGSSQGLDMGRLNTIKFDYAIYTNLTHEHLDYHKTMENYMKAKLKVFENTKDNALCIINTDDEYSKNFILDKNRNTLYGMNSNANYKIENPIYKLDKTIFDLNVNGSIRHVESPLLGDYNIYNLIPAIAILDDMKIPYEKYEPYIKELVTPDGRNEKIKYKDNLIIVDYAHTPDGIFKIGSAYKKINPNHLYIIFGERGSRDRTKRPEMLEIATDLADYVIVTDNHLYGEDGAQIINDIIKNPKNNNFEVIRDRKKAIEKGIELLDSNDVLLILGKGHETYLDIGSERIHFDDREVVREIISTKENKKVVS